MKGKLIKEVLSRHNVAQVEMAKILGITPNNLNNMLAKDDVRTGLLEAISEAANIPISVFYGESFGTSLSAHGNNNTQVAGNSNNVSTSDSEILALLRAKDEQLTLAMQQTSCAQMQTNKAQEQMDRVLERLLGNN